MPRDLEAMAKENALHDMPHLTQSPDHMQQDERPPAPVGKSDDHDEYEDGPFFSEMVQGNEKRDSLHPYVQTLSLSDLESCVKVEEEAFPPHERATREKFAYRLKTCGTLSLGIFTSHNPDLSTSPTIPTAPSAAPVYSGAPERKAVLLGHIIATKTSNPVVKDTDMAIPSSTDSSTTTFDSSSTPKTGHDELGRTLAIHSLAVLPTYQRRGLGKTLIRAYWQRMESHGVADRVALIAHKELVPWYEGLGFRCLGESKAEFGGGGWFDCVREMKAEGHEDEDDEDDEDENEGTGEGYVLPGS